LGVVEDIQKMYDSLYNSKIGTLENSKNEALMQLGHKETSINNQYKDTESNINKMRTDTQNSYIDKYSDLDTQAGEGKKKFYNDQNNAAVSNSKNTQAIRDYMARANLLQSGESVDALLRNQTDYTNTKNSIYAQENDFNKNINTTRSQFQRDEASAYAGLDNQIASALRNKDSNLKAILDERDQTHKSYNNSVGGLRSEVEYGRLGKVSEYNQAMEQRAYAEKQLQDQRAYEDKKALEEREYQAKMLAEERAYQERVAAASRSYSSGGSSGSSGSSKSSGSSGSSSTSTTQIKKDLKAEFQNLANTQQNHQAQLFLQENKQALTDQYGAAYYKELEDWYWNDLGDYYSNQAKVSNNKNKLAY